MWRPLSDNISFSRIIPLRNDSNFTGPDNENYKAIQKHVQTAFLKDQRDKVTLNLSRDSRLSEPALTHLVTNLNSAGFEVNVKRGVLSRLKGHQATISLPQEDQDESGYVSDGWKPDFRASKIKKQFEDNFNITKQEMTKVIKNHFHKNSDTRKWSFLLADFKCPDFLKSKLIQDLKEELKKEEIHLTSIKFYCNSTWVFLKTAPTKK